MVDCEDRRMKQVLGDIKKYKIKLNLKHHFQFFFPDWNAKKRAYYLQRGDFEDENAKLGISD